MFRDRDFAISVSAFAFLAAVGWLLTPAVSHAQVGPGHFGPPLSEYVDQTGVDLVTSRPMGSTSDLGIGSASSGLSRGSRSLAVGADDFFGTLSDTTSGSTTYRTVVLGNSAAQFQLQSGGTYTPTSGDSSTLTCTGLLCNYTSADGTVAVYDLSKSSSRGLWKGLGVLTQITRPDGEVIKLTYRVAVDVQGTSNYIYNYNIKAVYSSLGWMIKYQVVDTTDPSAAFQYTNIKALNTSVDYCDPDAEGCSSTSRSWMNLNYSWGTGTVSIANDLGQATTYSDFGINSEFNSTTTPSGVAKIITRYAAGNGSATGLVQSVSIGSSTWNYAYSFSGTTKTVTITDPNSGVRTVVVDTTAQHVLSDTDQLGRTTSFTYDSNGRLQQVIAPDATYSGATLTGGYTEYAYDSRGNLTTKTVVPKAGFGLANLVTTAHYPSSCSNIKTCNKPDYVIDAAGVRTDYTYDSNSGNIATITQPAVGGIAPQTRYSYSQFTPYVKNSSGSLVASTPVWRLTTVSSCQTGSAPSCLGTTDEVKTVIGYGTNNIQPTTMTTELGNNTFATTTTYTYDDYGNVTSADGPLPGSNDTIYYFYDALNRDVGEIGPDISGSGTRSASRTTYDADGRTAMVERGTVTGVTLSALNAMAVMDKTTTDFDGTTGLAIASKFYPTGASSPQSVTQASYDSALRISCIASRLNPSAFSSLPSACSLSTAGSDGKDQITQYTYDTTNSLLKVTTGYGTTEQSDDEIRTYNSSNGTLATVNDGKGNLTTYSYDGFDRKVKACMPTASNGAVSSTTDCAAVGFTGARATSKTLRDGQSLSYGYDADGRLNSQSGAGISESWTYDNFSQIETHTNNSLTETYSYNALGELLSDSQSLGTVNYEYDAYGRRSKLRFPAYGGVPFDVVYNYWNDGSLKNEQIVYNNGSPVTQLQYSFDGYGRLTGASSGSSSPVSATFGYDTGSRLTSIANNIGGTSYDNTISWGFTAANAIKQRVDSNGNFDFVPSPVSPASYTLDGLNQVSKVGSTNFSYDNRGNLTSDGAITYTYNSKNLLTGTSAGASLTYDAEDRLLSIAKSSTTTKFLYDGSNIIAEYNDSGTLLRRYIDGIDGEAAIWYEGADANQPRYLTSDQQGSVVGVTDSSGNNLAINSYDGFGIPAAGNLGRFQYTGQAYLAEVGLYYYRARMYSPSLGRFMQPDPIGYGDGLNIYNYVHGDPINGIDPSGLQEDAPTEVTVYVHATGYDPHLDGKLSLVDDSFDDLTRPKLFASAGDIPVTVVVVGKRRMKQDAPIIVLIDYHTQPSRHVPDCGKIIDNYVKAVRDEAEARQEAIDAGSAPPPPQAGDLNENDETDPSELANQLNDWDPTEPGRLGKALDEAERKLNAAKASYDNAIRGGYCTR